MHSKRKRHPITLLEIMIVILLIGVIGGVLSYNLKGTLDRGKKFRTEEGMKRLKEILEIEIEQGKTTIFTLFGKKSVILSNSDAVKNCVGGSGFIPDSNLDSFLVDGWKEPYFIEIDKEQLVITSRKLSEMN